MDGLCCGRFSSFLFSPLPPPPALPSPKYTILPAFVDITPVLFCFPPLSCLLALLLQVVPWKPDEKGRRNIAVNRV